MSGKISVIMGVYNCSLTIREAVESIINQTYKNWELIICNDGSTDDTSEIITDISKSESRIILLNNSVNLGLNYTLNKCLSVATGDFIARMDGDDISASNRFEKEVAFLNSQDEYKIVSTPMTLFDATGVWGKTSVIKYPKKKDIATGSPICHAPVMMKKECMDAVGGYTVDKRIIRVEDVDLWIKLYSKGYQCCNLTEPLYSMRNDKNAFNRRKYRFRFNETYVRLKGCKAFDLQFCCYFYAFRPMIVGLVPAGIRRYIRKKQNLRLY